MLGREDTDIKWVSFEPMALNYSAFKE